MVWKVRMKQIFLYFSSSHDEILKFALKKNIDYVIVGPEQPLVNGITDFLQKNNIKCFGPSKYASQLKVQKIFQEFYV